VLPKVKSLLLIFDNYKNNFSFGLRKKQYFNTNFKLYTHNLSRKNLSLSFEKLPTKNSIFENQISFDYICLILRDTFSGTGRFLIVDAKIFKTIF
jgi:hypothetical protein